MLLVRLFPLGLSYGGRQGDRTRILYRCNSNRRSLLRDAFDIMVFMAWLLQMGYIFEYPSFKMLPD
jgi:hypothetical protein